MSGILLGFQLKFLSKLSLEFYQKKFKKSQFSSNACPPFFGVDE